MNWDNDDGIIPPNCAVAPAHWPLPPFRRGGQGRGSRNGWRNHLGEAHPHRTLSATDSQEFILRSSRREANISDSACNSGQHFCHWQGLKTPVHSQQKGWSVRCGRQQRFAICPRR